VKTSRHVFLSWVRILAASVILDAVNLALGGCDRIQSHGLSTNSLRNSTSNAQQGILVRLTGLASSTGHRMSFAVHIATHNATHDKAHMHVLGRTYAAVRDLQVVKSAGKLQTEKAGVGGSTPSLATISFNNLAVSGSIVLVPIGAN
jgi:homoserine dehydrogenase